MNSLHLWNSKVHHRIHTCQPPVTILSQIEPVHSHKSHFLNIHLNIILQSRPGSYMWSHFLRFPHKTPVYASTLLIRATSPAQLILLDLITQTILGEEYRSLSFSLCSFLHSPVTPVTSSTFSSKPYPHTPSAYVLSSK